MTKTFLILFGGVILGAVIQFIAITNSPSLCRGVVVADIKAHEAYIAKLASVMPNGGHEDFLTTLTNAGKGK